MSDQACNPANVLMLDEKELRRALDDQTDPSFGYRYLHLGPFGAKREETLRKLDAALGPGRWRVMHRPGDGRLISREEVFEYFTQAYTEYFKTSAGRRVLTKLVTECRDIYDTAPSNVDSGEDFSAQETPANHFHDIAIRKAVRRLGRRFNPNGRLLEVRGDRSQASKFFRKTIGAAKSRKRQRLINPLSPGRVPFPHPEIVPGDVTLTGWWQPGSIEDFFQRSKVVVLEEDFEGYVENPGNGSQ